VSTTTRVLLESESIRAPLEESWSLGHRALLLWRIATNFRRQREILNFTRLPAYAEAATSDPKFAFKYLSDDYLALGLSLPERALCFTHHYTRLKEMLPKDVLQRTLRAEATVHEIHQGDDQFAITMGMSRPYTKEGELSLNLRVDGQIVFILSFTIVPGAVVASEAKEAMLISRIQGTPACYPQIRHVTKTLYDVAPNALLLAALQGIAVAAGIAEIAAVSSSTHRYSCAEFVPVLKNSYDDFFTELGVSRNSRGFYVSAVPLHEKPLAVIKHGHKIRTKEKRAFKKQILEACADFLGRGTAGIKQTQAGQSDVRVSDSLFSLES
jgi:uncharacterized protein VirK/YbjX